MAFDKSRGCPTPSSAGQLPTAAGDVDAFETLFRQHQGEVYRWITRIVRNNAVAEDLTL